MQAVRILAVVVYTLGAFAFGAMLVVWLRELGRAGWTGIPVSRRPGESEAVAGALTLLAFAWFLVNLLIEILRFAPELRGWPLQLAALWMTLTFPPLIMHVTLMEVLHGRRRQGARVPGLAWRPPLWIMYAGTQAVAAWAILAFSEILSVPQGRIPLLLNATVGPAFLVAAIYSIVLMAKYRPPTSNRRDVRSHRSVVALYVLMVPLFGVIAGLAVFDLWRHMPPAVGPLVDLLARSLPLAFIFVGTYHENRYEFFDIFVKRGLWLLVSLSLLAAGFAVALPLLMPFHGSWAAPWIYALFLLPIVLVGPWLHDRIARELDRRWLGRRFTTVDALKRFISGVRSATGERELVSRAEQCLSEIFGAPAEIRLAAGSPAASFEVVQEIPLRPGDRDEGRILLGRRSSEAPYFGTDLALAASLADVFSSVLDNLRLQAHRREHEQLAREMALQASRSELKALRAQINPHFLFNALNAIAGLIHREPAVADRTIEQLADVFRYVLRGSVDEWARVADELAFVESYLAIEQARFGSRLRVAVRCEPAASAVRVPTLAVQTLVENALKHGVMDVLGTAIVEVDARVTDGRLILSVADNGPGFDPTRPASPGGGYGLSNLRRRLDGYFGDAAGLHVDRDAARELTIVSLHLPCQPARGAVPRGTAATAGTAAEQPRRRHQDARG